MTSEVQPGEKFAYISLPGAPVDQDEFMEDNQEYLLCEDGDIQLWATLKFPVPEVEAGWRAQLGIIRANRITSASLYLVAKRVANVRSLTVLDEQNHELDSKVLDIYRALILAAPIETNSDIDRVSGAYRNDGGHINQHFSPFQRIYQIPGTQAKNMGMEEMSRTSKIYDIAKRIDTVDFSRLNKAIRSFWLASQSRFFDERIHQIARCIEGLILPEQARTKTQFRTRTELFVGNGNHKLMGNIYGVRSAIEHLNNPLDALEEVKPEDRKLYLYELAVQAECIARYCLGHILLSKDVMPHWKNDVTIQGFWEKPSQEKEEIWNSKFNVEDALSDFEPNEEVLKEFDRIF